MRFIHDLSPETQHLLRRGYKESQHHRVRQRAHCILLSFEGRTTTDLMHIFAVDRLTIYHWFDAWESRHFAGLYDHKGRGRHPKLTQEEQEKAQQYIDPISSRYEESRPSARTRDLQTCQYKNDQTSPKKNCYIWKRIKHAPEKTPDPEQYERSKALIQRLHTREMRGECDVWYFDGSRILLHTFYPLCMATYWISD